MNSNLIYFAIKQGGRLDPTLLAFVTSDGQSISPGTPQWNQLFDNLNFNQVLALLNGKYKWDEVFGWMSPLVFQYQGDLSGLFGWLTQERLDLLRGGRFDVASGHWFTRDNVEIVPGTELWSVYFGNLRPEELRILFPSGGTWEQYFSWLTPQWLFTVNPGLQVNWGMASGHGNYIACSFYY